MAAAQFNSVRISTSFFAAPGLAADGVRCRPASGRSDGFTANSPVRSNREWHFITDELRKARQCREPMLVSRLTAGRFRARGNACSIVRSYAFAPMQSVATPHAARVSDEALGVVTGAQKGSAIRHMLPTLGEIPVVRISTGSDEIGTISIHRIL